MGEFIDDALTQQGPLSDLATRFGDRETHPHQDDSDTEDTPVPAPIAIVGMAMRLPGGVSCEKEFWDFLVNKRDGLCKVPDTRYNIDAFYDDSRPGAIRTQHGYFLEHDIRRFDPEFFGISKIEAARLDPQQRMLLEVVWECMENGGQTGWRGKNIGCYVGVFGEDWLDVKIRDPQDPDRYRVVGSGHYALSNRVSYEYDLGGPSVTIQTACSSSLVGLHEACQALYSGECSSALVAGTNLIFTPTMTTSMSDNMVISRSGVCRTFDAAADGYGRGEAVNAIFIKPLDRALRDGDPVRAVIRSSAVNCDGKTPSISTPGSAAQERLIRRAYKKAGLEVSQTALFECHGTGTTVGDLAETSVVAKIFGDHGIHIGAVKPNVGHSEGASGITSVIQSVLALENHTIPPNVHFHTPNPNIPFETAKLKVAVEPTPWPTDRSERISINSFGIGGTNAHVILDSASSLRTDTSTHVDDSPQLLLVSAKSKASLEGQIKSLQTYLEKTDLPLTDVAYTLGLRREHLTHRAFALTESDGKVSSFERSTSVQAPLIFTFTGQGAQWPGMGSELIENVQTFREDIQMMDRVLQELESKPPWSIEDELLKCDKESRVAEAEFAQPLCTAVQIALVNLLRTWGTTADAVVGHSSGEIAAAYASGALSTDVAIILAYFRGQAMKTLSDRPGGMAAVGLGSEQARRFLKPGVVIACENSPDSVTLSGDSDVLSEVLDNIHANDGDTFCRKLAVDVAYHSHHMAEAGQVYEKMVSPHFSCQKSMAPMYSTVSGTIISDPSILSPSYWRRNLQSPVLFHTAIERILKDDEKLKVFLEIGPHSALSGPIRQSVAKADTKEHRYIPTLVRGKELWRSLLFTAGNLHAHGASVNLHSLIPKGKVVTELPPYSWQHSEIYWNEPRIVHDWRHRQHPHHELLGSQTLESNHLEPAWRNILKLENVLWLMDHKLGNEIIFPAAGYVAMAGEAVRRVTGSTDYSLRNIFIRSALILEDSAEIMTNLRPVKLTDHVDSLWFDFTISTYQNGKWKKHVVGQVRGGTDQEYDVPSKNTYSRQVDSDKWYDALKKRGLDYGPHFRGLEHITASPTVQQASAVLHSGEPPHSGYYALHPTTIDQCLQLFIAAATQGITRRMTRMCIPTAIESLYVSEGRGSMDLNVSCETIGGTMEVKSTLFSESRVALCLEKGFFFSVHDPESDDSNTLLASNVHWTPHIDYIPLEEQLPPHEPIIRGQTLAEATSAYIVEAYRLTRQSAPTSDHLKKYHTWIKNQYRKIEEKSPDLVPEMKKADVSVLGLNSPYADALRRDMREFHPSLTSFHRLAVRLCYALHDVLEGRTSPLALFMQDDEMKNFYDSMCATSPCEDFITLLGKSNPTIRILEIGAGTGGLTSIALKALSSDCGRLYSQYTFTDISAGFIADAQERFQEYDAVEYATLDITRDIEGQGYVPESYDLILAGNVLHATPQISSTLQNVRKLLAPGGRLLMQELCGDVPLVNFLMGVLPGWWLGENDGRPDSPALPIERWHEELVKASFTGVDAVRYADERQKSLSHTAVLLSEAKAPDTHARGGPIGLLYLSNISEWGRQLEKALSLAGYTVTWYTLQDISPSGSGVISLLDLEGPFFEHLSGDEFVLFQNYVSNLTGGHLLWITRSVQVTCEDPRFGLVLGMARTLRSELGHKFATVEIDRFDATAVASVLRILQTLRVQFHRPWLQSDYEYALQEGKILLPRNQWSSLDQQLASVSHLSAPRSLDIKYNGIFDSLRWTMSMSLISPPQLKEDEIEVDMKYVGLNFRDMMITMGFLGDTNQLGLEGSGIVRRVGSSVTHVKVGDRVAFIYDGLLRTRTLVPAAICHPVPAETSLEDAAALSIVFMTSIYCLITVGNLQKGQSVLIHSACGGVGLTAIQICRMIGAEMYVTVGTSEKVHYLTDVMKIPADRIFDSRSTSFLQGVLKATNGRGVDLVLNSLSGELLHASWKCVARFGKMVEIGKRDFLGHGKLDMDIFLQNRSFCSVDLRMIAQDNPTVLLGLVDQLTEYLKQGKLAPIRPVTVFDACDIVKAFRLMQTGQHMGKIIVRMPEDAESLPLTTVRDSVPIFRSDASYLLIGGLGGLGRAITTWMVEKGARNFIFLSRSGAKSPEAQVFLQDLESNETVSTMVVTGDVANNGDVQRAIAAAKSPVAGVLQMAMVLKDQMFYKMTYEEWTAALMPKVEGTWNLHYELQTTPLDFFVLFSSVAGIMGFGSQANYAAANTFLDSFVKYRHSQGLPASVLDIGFMGDIGYAAEQSPQTLKIVRAMDAQVLEERHLLQALEISIFSQSPCPSSQLILGNGAVNANSDHMVQEGRFGRWKNAGGSEKATTVPRSHEIRALLDEIQQNPKLLDEPSTHDKITVELGKVVAAHLAYSEDLSKEELAKIEIDSLMGIEIRSWFRRNAAIDISLVEISNAGTVGGLTTVAIKALRKKHLDGEEGPSLISQSSSAEPDELAICLEDMKLGDDMQPIPGTIPDWCSESEGRIFLTGATGFVGAFFLLDILALPQVKSVTCLVRTTDPESGKRRIEQTLARYGLPIDGLGKVTVVPGNIASPNLGMSKEDLDHHAQISSVVFHLAAHVNYTLPYSSHREANITGLLNVLKFVNTGHPKALHYWSSISACGVSGHLSGATIPEDKRAVLDRKFFELHVGYTRSKLVAESIVWNAIDNGFPISIYRPGIVMGHSGTGVDKPEDLSSRLMINCIQMGAFPVPPQQRNHIVPVDYVCAAILHIAKSPESHGHAFNVVPPAQDETITVADTFKILSDCCSTPLKAVSSAEWLHLFRERGKQGMKVATPMLQERLADSMIWWDTTSGMSTYETTNLRRALMDSPDILNVKPMPELLRTYYGHWEAATMDTDGTV